MKTFRFTGNTRVMTAFVVTILAALCLTARPAAAQGITVDDRPPVGLVLLDNLMSGKSQVGDRVHFETLANVYDDNKNLLIPAGCLAEGRVTRSKGSGMFGKRDELNFSASVVNEANRTDPLATDDARN